MKTKNLQIHRLALRGFLIAALIVFSTAPQAFDSNSPAAYAVRLPITVAPDAPLQRLQLPAQALVQLQSSNYSDVRIFNAQGQPVPMALSSVAASPAQRGLVKLVAFPIIGSAATTALDGVELRIEELQGKRVVQLSTGNVAAAPGTQKVLGALLDARQVKTPVVGITLDIDLPSARPVSFSIQASRDLKTWRELADTVLFKTDTGSLGASTLGAPNIELAAQDLADQYLRITWQGDTDQTTAVAVRGATLATAAAGSLVTRVSAAVTAPALSSPHEFSFKLPFATPLAALRIDAAGTNTLVPVRVLGRNDRSQPWAALASTVVYNLTANGKTQRSGAVALSSAVVSEIKIEADKNTPGFSAVPEVNVLFDPVQLVFLAGGAGPFTLAAGLSKAPLAYLPLASLMPAYQNGQENTLPVAAVQLGSAGPAVVSSAAADGRMPTRSLVLWGVLIAGALALAAMAWALTRQGSRNGKAASPEVAD